MIRILGTTFGGLMGLAFGSFLNVCLTRWVAGESVVSPGSHCRQCGHALRWWENVPLVSWMVQHGRCRECSAWIGLRYAVVELAVSATWAVAAWQAMPALYLPGWTNLSAFDAILFATEKMILCWLLMALAVLDAEHLWLPDWLTLGGAALGLPFTAARYGVHWIWSSIPLHWTTASGLGSHRTHIYDAIFRWVVGVVAAPLVILLGRWTYRAVRKREGLGLGDAKLMLMLAVWLGLWYTLLAFVLGVLIGGVGAVFVLVSPAHTQDGEENTESRALTKLPLGTFLCAGGMVSALWGGRIIAAYLRWCQL